MNKELELETGIKWNAAVRVDKYSAEQLKWLSDRIGQPLSVVENFRGDQLRCWFGPEEQAEAKGNLLTYVGLAYLLSVITGLTTTTTSSQLAFGFLPVGVGDGGGSVPTAAVTDSDLTASTNKYYSPVDSTYPAVGAAGSTAGILTIQSTFTSGVANFAWNEWGLYGSTSTFTTGTATKPSTATMINHKGVSLGTKVSGNVWTLSATITFS